MDYAKSSMTFEIYDAMFKTTELFDFSLRYWPSYAIPPFN